MTTIANSVNALAELETELTEYHAEKSRLNQQIAQVWQDEKTRDKLIQQVISLTGKITAAESRAQLLRSEHSTALLSEEIETFRAQVQSAVQHKQAHDTLMKKALDTLAQYNALREEYEQKFRGNRVNQKVINKAVNADPVHRTAYEQVLEAAGGRAAIAIDAQFLPIVR